MKWGAWGAQVAYKDRNGQEVAKSVPLGWWIRRRCRFLEPDAENRDGHICRRCCRQRPKRRKPVCGKRQYDHGLGFRAASRLTLDQQNFDNKNFAAVMAANKATPEKFNGFMAGSNGAIGAANGAFVGTPDEGGKPLGVMGNFGVAKPGYQRPAFTAALDKPSPTFANATPCNLTQAHPDRVSVAQGPYPT